MKIKFLSLILSMLSMVLILASCGESNSGDGAYTDTESENSSLPYSAEYASIPLSKFVPTEEEYLEIYNSSGMPTMPEGKEFINWDSTYMIYRSANSVTYNYEACYLDLEEHSITHLHNLGTKQQLNYMYKPALLYIQDVPGAITDAYTLNQEWNKLAGEDTLSGSTKYEFTKDGITYTKIKFIKQVYNGDGKLVIPDTVTITVKIDPDYCFDLNNYPPEYRDKIRN